MCITRFNDERQYYPSFAVARSVFLAMRVVTAIDVTLGRLFLAARFSRVLHSPDFSTQFNPLYLPTMIQLLPDTLYTRAYVLTISMSSIKSYLLITNHSNFLHFFSTRYILLFIFSRNQCLASIFRYMK